MSADRARIAPAVALGAWLVWVACIVFAYFTVPEEWVVALDGPLGGLRHGRHALAALARAAAGAAIVSLAAWAAGFAILQPVASLFSTGQERAVFRLGVGVGASSYACLALAWAGWYRPAVLRPALIAGAVAGAALLARRSRPAVVDRPRVPSRALSFAFSAATVIASAFALVGALAPEIEYDALWYHLWLPSRWLEAGHPVDIVEEFISLYPLTWELLFGAAMTLGGPVAAKLLHWICLPLLAITTALIARRLFPLASRAAAAAIAVVCPIAIWEATTAYVDLALAWYIALSLYALLRYFATDARGWLLLSAVTMGLALGVKNLALVSFAVAGTALLVREATVRRRLSSGLVNCAVYACIALVFGAPWYARAWAASGNPVFPDLYRVFGAAPAERWDGLSERELERYKRRFGRERTLSNLVRLPWDVTMHGARYRGTLGPVFLILLPLSLASGSAARWLLTACGAYVLIWASPLGSFQLRFLVPLLPVLGVLSAEGLRRLPRPAAVPVIGLLAMNLPPFTAWHESDLVRQGSPLTHVARGMPLGVVAGAQSEEAYLARHVPSYGAWRYINRSLPHGARVLTFSGGDHFYSARDRIWSDSTAARMATWGSPAGHERDALAAIATLKVTHVLFVRRQVVDGTVKRLAIGSDAMRACCLALVYEDERFALYRVR